MAEEARAKRVATGNKVRTTDVDQHMPLLAERLDDPWRRSEFIVRARGPIGAR